MAATRRRYMQKKVQCCIWSRCSRLATGFTFYNDIGTKCGKNARVETIQLVLGGKNTYLGSRTALEGESSALSSDVGYLVGANEHLDMNFVAYHTGKKTESRMDASGVLRENGFKLFRGTIDFRKGCARGSARKRGCTAA